MNTLKHIIDTITNYTAIQYADMMLDRERVANNKLHLFNVKTGSHKEQEIPYIEYMKSTWGYNGSEDLESCIERSRVSKLKEYAHYIVLYTGFIKNGRVFVLNKKEKFVSFLWDIRNGDKLQSSNGHKVGVTDLYTHYNPLNVDCISESVSSIHLFDKIGNNDYEISCDEKWIISECDKLIKNS